MRCQDILKNVHGLVCLFQLQQADSVFLQCSRLGIQERLAAREMLNSCGTLVILICNYRQHGVAGRIIWTQSQNVLQKRHSLRASGLVLQLGCSLQRWQIVRRYLQCALVGIQRRFLITFS